MSGSERTKACRRRKRNGRAVLRIEVDLGGIADRLVDGGYLQEWDAYDRDRVALALEEMVADLVAPT